MALDYGNAVVIDGGEVETSSSVNGSEMSVPNTIDGHEVNSLDAVDPHGAEPSVTYDGGEVSMRSMIDREVGSGGGGGSSETIWEITITNNSSKVDNINIFPTPYDDGNYYSLAYYIEYNGAFYVDSAYLNVAKGGTGVYKIHILTSLSELQAWANTGLISSVSGNATPPDHGTVTITGDCTVVIND